MDNERSIVLGVVVDAVDAGFSIEDIKPADSLSRGGCPGLGHYPARGGDATVGARR